MRSLFLITARGGSKGLPGKNIMPLGGKPLINYSVDFARQFVEDKDICVSTDDADIIKTVENNGLSVPFVRPAELATDNAGSYVVIQHAMNHFTELGIDYDNIVLLQPTSPFRKKADLEGMFNLMNPDVDAVVSVKPTDDNPLYTLYKEDSRGYLVKYYQQDVQRRQEIEDYYFLNGSIYVLNTSAIKKYPSIPDMPNKKKYPMDEISSLDIDTKFDFEFCQFILEKKLFQP